MSPKKQNRRRKKGKPRPPKLKIVHFRNPSGQIVYRVDGQTWGQRVRRNFPSMAEAESYRVSLTTQMTPNPVQPVPTRLTEAEVTDVEYAKTLLKNNGFTDTELTEAVRFYLDNNPTVADLDPSTAVEKFLDAKERRGLRENTITILRYCLEKFLRSTKAKRVSEITLAELEAFIFDKEAAAQTQHDRKKHLNNWFSWM